MGMLQGNNHQVMPYRDEHLAIDFDQQAASLDTERMTLTRKEYDLLALLVQHAGEIIPREALLMQVWGYGAEIRTRTLRSSAQLPRAGATSIRISASVTGSNRTARRAFFKDS